LAISRKQRSFLPLQPLCRHLVPKAAVQGIPRAGELLQAVLDGAEFDRHLWRGLVADLLLLAADETPEIPLAPRSLKRLLGVPEGERSREAFTPIEQALSSSRELTFGPYPYRPLTVGWNDREDVGRLANELKQIDATGWQPSDLAGLPELAEPEEWQEELTFAREGLTALADFYHRSATRCVIVCEAEP
jgi:hypothetical protein